MKGYCLITTTIVMLYKEKKLIKDIFVNRFTIRNGFSAYVLSQSGNKPWKWSLNGSGWNNSRFCLSNDLPG